MVNGTRGMPGRAGAPGGAKGGKAVAGPVPSRGRGRTDKRRAILDAAFTVFARRGYAQAGMQEIADEARVAKPTLYNHLSDKETLFLGAMEAAARALTAENIAVVERLRDCGPDDDLPAALRDTVHRMARLCCGERSRALRALTYAQLAEFPDLLDTVHGQTATRLTESLADRLARFSLAGRLRPCDPRQAAEHLVALLTGPLETRSRLGTRKLPDAEVKSLAHAAVDTFLRAYAPSESEPAG